MMFDELLDVDMDEMIYAYYGGMLRLQASAACDA